jgi:hypothetical protein
MTRTIKGGIILIMVGAFIPSVLYPFSSLTTSAAVIQGLFASRGVLYTPRLKDLEVVMKEGNLVTKAVAREGKITAIDHYDGRIAVPYHYVVATGIIIAFLGIGLIALKGKAFSPPLAPHGTMIQV